MSRLLPMSVVLGLFLLSGCPPPVTDGGVGLDDEDSGVVGLSDAGPRGDGGPGTSTDAGGTSDAGSSSNDGGEVGIVDAGVVDAGIVPDAGVVGTVTPEPACANVDVAPRTVVAGELVTLQGIPLGTSFRVRVRAAHLQGAVSVPLGVMDDDDSDNVQLVMRAPSTPDTMNHTTRYVVETSSDNGQSFCHYTSLDVRALEPVGDETFATQVTAISNLHAALMAAYGIASSDLDAATPLEMERLAPFVFAQGLIDHPDNPESLAAIVDGTASVQLSTTDREYLDRLVATARTHLIPEPAPLPSLADCGVALDDIETAEQLSCWMTVGRDVNRLLGSTPVVALRATIAAAIGAAGVVASAPSAGATLAAAGLANAAINASIDAASNLTPNSFTHLSARTTGTHVCQNEYLQVLSADVWVRSKGWDITYVQALDWALGIVSVFQAARALSSAAEAAQVAQVAESAKELIEAQLQNAVPHINNILINYFGVAVPSAPNALVMVSIPPAHWGPIDLPLQYLALSTNGPNVTLAGAAYTATAGRGHVKVAVEPGLFGGAEASQEVAVIGHDATIDVDNLHAQPGEDLLATATVHCASGVSLFWTMDHNAQAEGGAPIDRDIGTFTMPTCPMGRTECVFPDAITATDVSGMGLSEGKGSITISTCCSSNPPPSCRASVMCDCPEAPAACNISAVECGTAGSSEVCDLSLSVGPHNECIAPGGSLQLGAYNQVGSVADVTWTVRAADSGSPGQVTPAGMLTAPSRNTTLEVTATSNVVQGAHTTATVLVADSCQGWRATTAVGFFAGDLVSMPFALATDDGAFPIMLGELDATDMSGTLLLLNHPGRTEGCSGPTGTYLGNIHVIDAPSPMALRGAGGENVIVDILRFDSVAFEAHVRGFGLGFVAGNDEEIPTTINGRVCLPGSGCADPADSTDFGQRFGHYFQPDANMCVEMFEGGIVNQMFWNQFCSAGDVTCVDDEPCPAEGRIGRCDLRAGSVSAPFNSVNTHYPDPEQDLATLVEVCLLQGGRWLP